MRPEAIAIVCVYLGFAVLEAFRSDLFRKPGQRRLDWIVELVATLGLLTLIQPAILFASGALLTALAPQWQGALAGIPWYAALALFLLGDDMMQYWWHRLAHASPLLYHFHRAHHDCTYMSVRVVYRNNLLYYATLPGIWLSGVLIWLGLGWVYVFYVTVKLTVIIAAHSDVKWDKPLYRIKALAPLMWLVERTISTPATHHAHHGRHLSDGITHYKGNYGNLLFFWDILFGTAKITRRYPPAYGLENLPPASAGALLAWPLLRDKSE